MKKHMRHLELSGKMCSYPGCTKRIKKSVLARNSTAHLCYEHHCEMIGRNPRSRKMNRSAHNTRRHKLLLLAGKIEKPE